MTPEFLPTKQQRLRAVFSDIDGTIVHYDAKLKQQGYELVEVIAHSAGDQVRECSSKFDDTRRHIWRHIATDTLIETVPVPSATLGGGFISTKTLRLVKEMREKFGVKYCLLTGARTSTFLSRVESKSLPEFDFGVCEGGGKIFSRVSENGDSCASLKLDEVWLDSFSPSIGSSWKETAKPEIPPERRAGPLWDLYRMLQTTEDLLGKGSGLPKLDAKSFDSAFMVDLRSASQQKQQNSSSPIFASLASPTSVPTSNVLVCGVAEVGQLEESLKKLIFENSTFKDKLTVCVNLGKGHISAKGCTKADVVEYLSSKKIVPPISLLGSPTPRKKEIATKSYSKEDEEEVERKQGKEQENVIEEIVAAMFDDENDLEFVKLCHIGFAPGVAHPAVDEFFAKHDQTRYRKCKIEGFLGTEEALSFLMEKFCRE